MMKRKFLALLAVASAAFFIAGNTLAQNSGTVTNHAVAIGKGPGVQGFGSAVPGAAGLPLLSTGASTDPAFGPFSSLAINGCVIPGGAVLCAAGNITSTTGFVSPVMFGGTATGSSLTLQSTTSGSPSGDATNLYGSTVTIGNSINGSATLNLGAPAGGGVAVNIGSATNGLGAFNVFNAAGSKQTWVPGGGNTTITFPTATDTLVARTTTDTMANKTLASPTLTGPVGISGAGAALTVQTGTVSALAVGLGGATNPAFVVDTSTASQAAGLNVKGAATGGTVAIAAIDSGANTNFAIDAKGTGTINIAQNSTGAVAIGNVSPTINFGQSGATTVNIGKAAASSGALTIAGSTSGATTIIPQAVASGALTLPNGPATLTATIASGSMALGTGAIASGACAAAQTAAATGVATTDTITAAFNADPTAVTGYIPLAMLTIIPYPTLNTVNVKVCNNTGSSITPGAVTINWRVVR